MKRLPLPLLLASVSGIFVLHWPGPALKAEETIPQAEVREDAPESPAEASSGAPSSYVFGWGTLPGKLAAPRGGSSKGAPVELAPARPLPLPEIASAADSLAKDRAAIRSFAGDFRVSFHFMDTLGLLPEDKPRRPYHSWATERVEILSDEERFLSLQHTLVMYFTEEDGSISEPALTKHWRQDWTYEATDYHAYVGKDTWERVAPASEAAAETWTQTVYQVDDSPRYAATGKWEHRGNVSEWRAEPFLRPLPRRESTVRKDYDALEGRDVIVITPTGWLHEQHNWKRVLSGDPSAPPSYVASEFGLNRYERILSPSLEEAAAYWKKTGPYWAEVRAAWKDVLASHDRFSMKSKVKGDRLYERHFERAETIAEGEAFAAADERELAAETIKAFLSAGD
jgi:hypothetical protein